MWTDLSGFLVKFVRLLTPGTRTDLSGIGRNPDRFVRHILGRWTDLSGFPEVNLPVFAVIFDGYIVRIDKLGKESSDRSFVTI